MNTPREMAFNIKARIGGTLVESFFKKTGKRLGATLGIHRGKTDISWSAIDNNKKETLVFLHGFSDRKESFYFASHHLKNEVNLVLPDMPGFGRSTADPGLTYSLENYCAWLREFIEAAGIGRCHLAGSSLGGAVAALLALDMPERFKSLTLVGSAGFYLPGYRSVYDDALDGINIFRIDSAEAFEALRKKIFKTPPALPAFVREFMIKTAMDNRDWYGKVFNDLGNLDRVKEGHQTLEEMSFNRFCGDFKMKTLLLWGRHDTLFPCRTAAFLAEKMPDARVHIFDNLGHVPQIEHPREFAGALSGFLRAFG